MANGRQAFTSLVLLAPATRLHTIQSVRQKNALAANHPKDMRFVKIFSAVAAFHIVLLAFFFFKPTVRYFTSTCVSTVLVWAGVFAIRERGPWIMAAGWIVQLSIQNYAYRSWQAEQSK